MSRKPIIINNVEELLDYATRRETDNRFELVYRPSEAYVDPQAGAEYDAQHSAIWEKWTNTRKTMNYGSPEIEQTWIDQDADFAKLTKPATFKVIDYWLRENTSSNWRSGDDVELSRDFGEIVESIWTKREAYRGAGYKVVKGSLSLNGILKRLGNTALDARLKAKRDLNARRDFANRTNSDIRTVRENAADLRKALERLQHDNPEYSALAGPSFFQTLSAMIGLAEVEIPTK